jgi:hypothetical protein
MPTATPNDFAAAVIPLLKEYTAKLEHFCEEKQDIAKPRSPEDHRKILMLRERFAKLASPLHHLAEHVSQQIEHGKLDDLARLELKLRLAELEGAMQMTESLIHSS